DGLEIGGQQQEYGDDRNNEAHGQAARHVVHRRNLATDIDLGALWRFAGVFDCFGYLTRDRAQVGAHAVGGQRPLPLHVVTVVLSGHAAGADVGDVTEQHLLAAFALQRNLAEVLRGADVPRAIHAANDRPRNLDLHLVGNPRFWIG